jgi:hypothetical protein
MSGQFHAPAHLPPRERGPGTHWIGGWEGPRTGLDDVERRKIFTVPGLEHHLLGRPARSQSLYWLRFPGSHIWISLLDLLALSRKGWITIKTPRSRYRNGHVVHWPEYFGFPHLNTYSISFAIFQSIIHVKETSLNMMRVISIMEPCSSVYKIILVALFAQIYSR